ncbi:MAG: YncE family protein [Gemmataceae bacterium]|nr:YncE family protein [Gemmataceae bacterium]
MKLMRPTLIAALVLMGIAAGGPAQTTDTPKRVFVVNTGDGSVSLVDIPGMKEIERHKVGPRPYGIAVSQDGKKVAVGVEDEECVKFYSLPEFKLLGRTSIGKMFNDHIVLTSDGKHIVVANYYSDDVLGINMETMKEEWRIKDLSAPHVVRYGTLGKHMFVTCKKASGVAIIDPLERKLVKFHPLTVNPRSLTFSPDESKVFCGSHWVNGIFEADLKTGKVSRLIELTPPPDKTAPQEVTYHGVQAIHGNIVLAANEGRSFLDAVDMRTGKLLARLADVSKPCCIEPVPGTNRVMLSNLGDGSLQFVDVSKEGDLKSVGKAMVGKAPKRVAFLPK